MAGGLSGLTGLSGLSGIAGGGAWTPSSISSLVAWWSSAGSVYSDAGTTRVVDTDPVYRVTPRNTSSFNADQATLANRPIWSANSGVPYMTFDGTNDFLSPGNSSSLNPTSGMTLYAKVRPSVVASTGFVMTRDDNALGRAFSFGFTASKLYLEVSGAATMNDAAGAVSINTIYNICVIGNAANGWKSYINGVNKQSVAWAAPNSTTGNTNLGRRTYSGAEGYYNGRIYDALLFNDAISAADLARLETYFA